MATYDLTSVIPSSIESGDVLNCPYSGVVKSITLPKGVYQLEVWGAQGGDYSTSYKGGRGGYSNGVLTLKNEETLFLYAGGAGSRISRTGSAQGGGFNGGGNATTTSTSYYTCGGGGGSDIRIGTDSLYARVIVAGGGGGCNYNSYGKGGAGGGTSGTSGTASSTTYTAGAGGSQTKVGSSYYGTTVNSTTYSDLGGFGQGANAKTSSSYSSGGGGGWYGGGSARRAGGGGGSGYVFTESTASNYPSGCLLTSDYYLAEASTIDGDSSFTDPNTGSSATGRTGAGYVRITVVEIETLQVFMKQADSWVKASSVYVKTDGSWQPVKMIRFKNGGSWT